MHNVKMYEKEITLNLIQTVHIPESIQHKTLVLQSTGSKSSSVTSFVTIDLRHTPQNF